MSNSNPLYAYSLTQSKAKEVMAYIRSKSSNQPGKGAANQQNKYLKTNILPYDLREVVSTKSRGADTSAWPDQSGLLQTDVE